jgi:hypothetical protein
LLAVCYLGGEDLNERIVREGWALDFRKYAGRVGGQARRRRHLARSSPRHGRGAPLVAEPCSWLAGYARGMAWQGQDPPATEAILQLIMPCSGGRMPARPGIEELTDGIT